MTVIDKVYAYITYGDDLLVFEQPDFPDAGVQVPGGTLESGEAPIAGALREAQEETGLRDLQLVRLLGTRSVPVAPATVHRRHFFHLIAPTRVSNTWDHLEREPSTGGPPIRFRFRWVPRTACPPLKAELDALIGQLSLGLERPPTATPEPRTTVRFASRILLLDDSNRLLLLSATSFSGEPFWVAPGGGLDAREHYCDAILREVREEVGVSVELGPLVWLRRHALELPTGGIFDQTERFFVGRTQSTDIKPIRQDDYVNGHRWWSLAELLDSAEVFAPRALGKHLENIVEGSFPEEPFDVGI